VAADVACTAGDEDFHVQLQDPRLRGSAIFKSL